MAKVLIFNNFLKNGESSILAAGLSSLHQYDSAGPGRLRANPYGKSKHIGPKDLLQRVINSVRLWLRWRKYDVLIVDSAITGLLVACVSVLGKGRRKLVISSFNVPRRRTGLWKKLATVLYRKVDHFFVHSTCDMELATSLYRLPHSRFSYRPFIRATPATGQPENIYMFEDNRPFILSFGGNARDYATFFRAIAQTSLSAIVVAREYNLTGLKIPHNVRTFCNIPLPECDKLVSKCLFTVFAFDGSEPSCGQISIVTSFMLGKPTICTDLTGVGDYVCHGKNGLLVKPADPGELRDKMLTLAQDEQLYERLSEGALGWANENTNPQAVHNKIENLVTELTSPH